MPQGLNLVFALHWRRFVAVRRKRQNFRRNEPVPKFVDVHALLRNCLRKILHDGIAPLQPTVFVDDDNSFGQLRHCVIHHVVEIADDVFAVLSEFFFAISAPLEGKPNQQCPYQSRRRAQNFVVLRNNRDHYEHYRQVYYGVRPRGQNSRHLIISRQKAAYDNRTAYPSSPLSPRAERTTYSTAQSHTKARARILRRCIGRRRTT